MLDVKNILTEELERSKTAIIDNMTANNQVVTGRTKNSLRVDVGENEGILWGAEHIKTLETGISPFESAQISYSSLVDKLDAWVLLKHGTTIFRNILPPNVKDAYQNQRLFGSTLYRETGGTPTGLVYGKEVNPLLQRIGSRIVDKIINIKVIT